MSKRNSEGEVLFNRFAVGLAQKEQQLASLFGGAPPAQAESHDEQPAEQTKIADLKEHGDEESFGLGAVVPKEIQDGSFTNRVPTSNVKLLENLIGKKAAKAHLAAKQKHAAVTKPPKPVRPAPAKEESDDEDGRAATFKSKRQKRARPAPAMQDDSDDEDEESRAARVALKKLKTAHIDIPDAVEEPEDTPQEKDNEPQPDVEVEVEEVDEAEKPASPVRPAKAKPKSYLDEILGEKAKKKKKKAKSTTVTVAA